MRLSYREATCCSVFGLQSITTDMQLRTAFDEMWADGSAIRRPYQNIKAWLDSEDRPSLKA